MIKATKFWMQTTKSKCFAAWTIYSQISSKFLYNISNFYYYNNSH